MLRFPLSLLLALLFATPALAQQETLESILAKGAKRLSAAEIKTTLVGNSVEGPFTDGAVLTVYYKGDGSLGGTNHTEGASFYGSWTVDDRGVQCLEYSIPGWGGGSTCRLWFQIGNVFYVLESESDEDRSQPVYIRTRSQR